MKSKIEWNVDMLANFIRLGHLTEEQKEIMRLRTSDNLDKEIADELGVSIATYYRRLAEIKAIYDKIQKENPEIFPERRKIKQKEFRINTSEELISFAENTNFDKYYIKMQFIRKANRKKEPI